MLSVCCNVQSNWSFLNKRLADFFNTGRIIFSLALVLQRAQTIQYIVNEVLSKSLIIVSCVKVFNFFTHSYLRFYCKTLIQETVGFLLNLVKLFANQWVQNTRANTKVKFFIENSEAFPFFFYILFILELCNMHLPDLLYVLYCS